jgi:GTP-binding protein Era
MAEGHKSGFVNIVGLPNVGKSTLMNALTGERLSIITPKAQTTRHRITGIVNDENYQVVFSDTPGYINQPAYKLQNSMNDFVDEALEDADVILFVTDKNQKEEEQAHLIELLSKTKAASLVLINKMDLCQQGEVEKLTAYWKEKLPKSEILAISAASGINSKKVIKKIVELLPEHPAYYDKDQLTDRNVRFFVAEIVREKIFLNYSAEIPYSCQVEVDTYEESEKIDKIRCVIYVERESQKMILIGKKGESLKTIGIEARAEIEKFLGKHVHLELFVKVKDKWRNDPISLKHFGYDNK